LLVLLGADPAVTCLAHIVHAADITGDVETDRLAPELAAIGQAGLDVEANDEWLVELGMFVYDALCAWCKRQAYPPGQAR
jgi:hypothetical protein